MLRHPGYYSVLAALALAACASPRDPDVRYNLGQSCTGNLVADIGVDRAAGRDHNLLQEDLE